MKGIIIFDLDGTICDSMESHSIAFAKSLNKNYGIDEILSKKIYFETSGAPLDFQFKKVIRHSLNKEVSDKSIQVLINQFWNILSGHEVIIFPGIDLLIKVLYKLNYFLCVSTGSEYFVAEKVLKGNNIFDEFHVVAGSDYSKSSRFKKGEAHIDYIKKKLNIKTKYFTQNTLIVSDGISDMKFAKDLSVFGVGVPTTNSSQQLYDSGANIVIERTVDLYSLLIWDGEFRTMKDAIEKIKMHSI